MNTMSRGRRIAGWVLTGLLTASLLVSASGKLFGMAKVVEMMQKWGLGNHLLLIGMGELVSALLFAIPKTHSLGSCCSRVTWEEPSSRTCSMTNRSSCNQSTWS